MGAEERGQGNYRSQSYEMSDLKVRLSPSLSVKVVQVVGALALAVIRPCLDAGKFYHYAILSPEGFASHSMEGDGTRAMEIGRADENHFS